MKQDGTYAYITKRVDRIFEKNNVIMYAMEDFCQLEPAYDLLPVNVIMPEDREQLALPINGKKMNIRKKDFLIFAEECGISCVSAEKMINSLTKKKHKLLKMCEESYLPEHLKSHFCELLEKRMAVLL